MGVAGNNKDCVKNQNMNNIEPNNNIYHRGINFGQNQINRNNDQINCFNQGGNNDPMNNCNQNNNNNQMNGFNQSSMNNNPMINCNQNIQGNIFNCNQNKEKNYTKIMMNVFYKDQNENNLKNFNLNNVYLKPKKIGVMNNNNFVQMRNNNNGQIFNNQIGNDNQLQMGNNYYYNCNNCNYNYNYNQMPNNGYI